MTFSLAARCQQTGMFGVAVTTSSVAVGARCPFARAKVGAVLTQHRTDPRLGPEGLDMLAAGKSAEATIKALVASTPDHGWRQLAVIDSVGRTAHYSGNKIESINSGAVGDNVVAVGNLLRNTEIPAAMVRDFERAPTRHLADRLIDALAAGLAAGGENSPLHSASLLLVRDHSFPFVDLRVDDDPDPIGRLRAVWAAYAPMAETYQRWAVTPDDAPSFADAAAGRV